MIIPAHLNRGGLFQILHPAAMRAPKGFRPIPRVFAGCCEPLLGVGASRRYLHTPCIGAWSHTPS